MGHITPPHGVGVGQVWWDKTASRVINTAYRNTTGRPIVVFVAVTCAANWQTHQILLSDDGITWPYVAAHEYDYDAAGHGLAVSAIVPPGMYYKVPLHTLNKWLELI